MTRYIAFDFDGTVVTHKYPIIGDELACAIVVLKELQDKGYKLILLTMRSNETLDKAVKYLNERGLKDFYVNENPTQINWTQSRKVYAELYIDDAALGCPLKFDSDSKRYCVDWLSVRKLLSDRGYL